MLFKKARYHENSVRDLNDFDGTESLNDSDREYLQVAVTRNNDGRVDASPKNSARGKSKIQKRITLVTRKKKLAVRTDPSIKILFANADQLTTPKKDELLAQIQT